MKRTLMNPPGAKPFLKWAGGKAQILRELEECLPCEMKDGHIRTYIEPFVGGGAMFFALSRKYRFEHSVICDINRELILCYSVLKKSPKDLIDRLGYLESAFENKNDSGRKDLFYTIRDRFNRDGGDFDFTLKNPDRAERAAQLIFLNKTCYNGLFRVNKNGGFNVPFGRYKNPDILNEENLREAARSLKKTKIFHGDFTRCRNYVGNSSFVYCDPPYRPLSQSSSFTQYAKGGFSDHDQKRLAKFLHTSDRKGALFMLSNSDPLSINPLDRFFENLYDRFSRERVPARRSINCCGKGRGAINELIVTNYRQPETNFE